MKYKPLTKLHLFIQVLLFPVLVFLDQICKELAIRNLQAKPDISLIDGALYLHYLENDGAAFGIFRNGKWLFYIFTIIVLAVLVFIFIKIWRTLFRSSHERPVRHVIWLGYGLCVLGAGAAGNLIDRLIRGYVIDFIDVRLIQFPVFNLADIYVTVSCIFIVICFLFIYKKGDIPN